MNSLTTSKRISLVFALYTIGIVLFFGVAINIIFFRQRYSIEQQKLRLPAEAAQITAPHSRFARPLFETFVNDKWTRSTLRKNTVLFKISSIDDEYVMYMSEGDIIKVILVSRQVEAQIRLIKIFLLLAVVFSFLTYASSLLIVKYQLKNINMLVNYVRQLDLHSIEKPVPISGPEHDEIRVIGESLQQSLTLIKQQTDSLKDFITYTSHELKTPLMSLNATIDLWLKKWTYEETLAEAKKTIYHINSLFDTLLSITKREYQQIQKEHIDLVLLIQEVIAIVSNVYAAKKQKLHLILPDTYILLANKDSTYTILYNLIQNAYKYTPKNWEITLTLDNNCLHISDTWSWIPDEYKIHIRKKFRKHHAENDDKEWFWLGLYLVDLLVKKQGRKISVDNNQSHESWSTFTLYFS